MYEDTENGGRLQSAIGDLLKYDLTLPSPGKERVKKYYASE
jgi:hypothetical protein